MTQTPPADQIAAAQAALDQHDAAITSPWRATAEYVAKNLTQPIVSPAEIVHTRRDAERELRRVKTAYPARTFRMTHNANWRRYEIVQINRDLRIEPPTLRELEGWCATANPDDRGPAALRQMFS